MFSEFSCRLIAVGMILPRIHDSIKCNARAHLYTARLQHNSARLKLKNKYKNLSLSEYGPINHFTDAFLKSLRLNPRLAVSTFLMSSMSPRPQESQYSTCAWAATPWWVSTLLVARSKTEPKMIPTQTNQLRDAMQPHGNSSTHSILRVPSGNSCPLMNSSATHVKRSRPQTAKTTVLPGLLLYISHPRIHMGNIL